MTKAAFRNALTVLQAIGGSTNALVHLTAVARRLGIEIELEEFDEIGRNVPVLVDLKPPVWMRHGDQPQPHEWAVSVHNAAARCEGWRMGGRSGLRGAAIGRAIADGLRSKFDGACRAVLDGPGNPLDRVGSVYSLAYAFGLRPTKTVAGTRNDGDSGV